jgi:hypothetical protein
LKFDLVKGTSVLLIVSGMIVTTILINLTGIDMINGQIPPVPNLPNVTGMTTVTKPPQPSKMSSSIAHGVKITSPIKGQQVPTGILTIAGTSKDNATSDCHVNVIVNGIKPYQNASANGPSGANDYSKWNFTLSPEYTFIKQGINKITAKFWCNPNPNLSMASFYSVNVTGVGGGSSATIAKQLPSTSSPAAITGNSSTVRKNNTVMVNSSEFPFGAG